MTNKITQPDYTQNRGTYQLALPMNMEIMIPPEDSVRLLSQIMEELDYRKLYEAYSQTGRKATVSPVKFFKIMVYGYMNGIYSSRAIEKACRRDINFMWLLEGQSPPDHNTIARFRTQRLAGVVEDLFSQLVIKLGEKGEIAYENIFIDGTKIEANANKYSFVWKKATTKHAAKLKTKINAFLLQTNQKYGYDFSTDSSLEQIQVFFEKKRQEKNIDFVSGKGTRKSSLQRDVETLNELVARQDKYRKYEKTFGGRNSFSKTDEDATFMHMKEDHMRNSQLKPGYNVQIGVEGEYIVGMDISEERSDQLTLIPFLEKMKNNVGKKHKHVIADAGYESEENYAHLQEQQQGCYIKPANYERSKARKYKSNMHLRENMPYDKGLDEYLCPNGKKLKAIGKTKRVSKSDYEAKITVYECEGCEGCPIKSKCTKAKGNRRMNISKTFLAQREKSLQNILSPLGIVLRMNRSIQVEGAFGVLKEDYGFRRFLTRGKKNVGIEFLLLGLGYNINKLHHKIQQNRCGSLLHKMIA
jgi:transposase